MKLQQTLTLKKATEIEIAAEIKSHFSKLHIGPLSVCVCVCVCKLFALNTIGDGRGHWRCSEFVSTVCPLCLQGWESWSSEGRGMSWKNSATFLLNLLILLLLLLLLPLPPPSSPPPSSSSSSSSSASSSSLLPLPSSSSSSSSSSSPPLLLLPPPPLLLLLLPSPLR